MAVAKCDRDTAMMALLRQRPARSGRISANKQSMRSRTGQCTRADAQVDVGAHVRGLILIEQRGFIHENRFSPAACGL